jgi:hypothetical protein
MPPPDGRVVYQESGALDILKARRVVLAGFPDDDYIGQNERHPPSSTI